MSAMTRPARSFASCVLGTLFGVSSLLCVSVGVLSAQTGAPSAGAMLRVLDFQTYRDQVEPIFLNRRPGNARCVVCHSRGGGNSFLEPLAPDSDSYDEAQSFRNFERIQRLVVPGEPLESILLVNPLAEEAGGSHWHGGGKHWSSQDDPEWRILGDWVSDASIGVDFEFYRERVEPIFLSRRPGNARCVVCHSRGGGNSFLEPMTSDGGTYDEAQSLRNFDRVQRLVVPGEPLESILLVNPLTEEAGGSHWHGGGKHWSSQDADEWQTLAAWVSKLATRKLNVDMPKFEAATNYSLKKTLKAMGMPTAFDPKNGDFSGMTSSRVWEEQLYISAVIHQAKIMVDEVGTEAAAATAVVMRMKGGRPKSYPFNPNFRANHPFLYLIRDTRTGAVLFLGRMIKPD